MVDRGLTAEVSRERTPRASLSYWNTSRRAIPSATSPIRFPLDVWDEPN